MVLIIYIAMAIYLHNKDNSLNAVEKDSSIIENSNITNETTDITSNDIENNIVDNNTTDIQKQTIDTTNEKNKNIENQKKDSVNKDKVTTSQKQDNIKKDVSKDTTTSNPSAPSTSSNNKPVEKPVEKPVNKKCTTNNNHDIEIGNSGKWFDKKESAIKEYNSKTAYWGKKWENFEIDDDTYYANCPIGYEVISCPNCVKWTLDYHYRK